MKKTIKHSKVSVSRKNKKGIIFGSIMVLVLIGFFLGKNSIVQKSKHGADQPDNQVVSSSAALVEKYKKELPDLKKKADSGNQDDLQNYGMAQSETGDLVGAEATYRKQVDLESGSVTAHNNLANALRYQGKFDDAISEYREVIKMAPHSISSYSNLANLYQYFLGKNEEAIDVYKEAIAQNKDSAEAYVLLANVYESSGDNNSAKEYFQKAHDIQPENSAAVDGLERLK